MLITNTMVEFLEEHEGQDEMVALHHFKARFGLTDEEALTVYDAWRRHDYSGHQTRYVEQHP